MNKSNGYIGIDPGKQGFLCLLTDDELTRFAPMPVVTADRGKSQYDLPLLRLTLQDWLFSLRRVMVIVEAQQAFPGQGGTSNFSTGYGYGLLHGMLNGLGLPYISPHPRTWQKQMLADVPGTDPKQRSVVAAGRLFPGVDLRASVRCRVPHDGKADSLLLAEWGRRNFGGEERR